MKATWKILNSIINRKNTKPKINSIFKLDGRVTSDAFEISNQFCNYFSNIGPWLDGKIPTLLVPVKSFLSGQFSNTVFLQPVSKNEIKNITKYDNISMSIVKLTINYILRPLTHIINLSLSQG